MATEKRANYVHDDIPEELRDLAGEHLQVARTWAEGNGDDKAAAGHASVSIAASLLALVDYAARADARAEREPHPLHDVLFEIVPMLNNIGVQLKEIADSLPNATTS